ncbi:MAG: hypothetical protein D6798_06600 [Deltaproteobacteria bacterium]|nr:MAG: hypothetical protein D6798_06600 [Deltaproteobacteria bacterium]
MSDTIEELFQLARAGDADAFRAVAGNVSAADLVGAVDRFGDSLLHAAASGGSPDIVDQFLAAGPKASVKGEDKRTPMHVAAREGHVPVMERLVKKRASVKARDKYGNQPLHLAAIGGHLDAVRWLVETRKAPINETNRAGDAPLHMAATEDEEAVVAWLLDHGADPTIEDPYSGNPLGHALSNMAFRSARTLARRMPDFDRSGEHAAELAVLAGRHGDIDTLAWLVEGGCSLDVHGHSGFTPLIALAYHSNVPGPNKVEVARWLLDRGAMVDARDHDERTALHRAAANGDLELARFLVEQGADPGAVDDEGHTLLHEAARAPEPEMAAWVLSLGSPVDPETHDGWTPLMLAAMEGRAATVRLLLDRGADLYKADAASPFLVLAVATDDPELIRTAVEAGLDPNRPDSIGFTPLHKAVLANKPRSAEALLEAGADPNRTTRSGDTPLDLARSMNREEVAAILEAVMG